MPPDPTPTPVHLGRLQEAAEGATNGSLSMDPDYAGHALDTFNDLADPPTVIALCQALREWHGCLRVMANPDGKSEYERDEGELRQMARIALNRVGALVDFAQPPDPEEPA